MWSAFCQRFSLMQQERREQRTPINKNGFFSSASASYSTMSPHITADQVTEFLRSNPDFLERHVIEETELEQLERWIIRKSQRTKKKTETTSNKNGRKTSLSRWKFCVHADKRQMLQDLTQSLQVKPTKDHVLWELASCISSAVNSDGFRLYLPDSAKSGALIDYLEQYPRTEDVDSTQRLGVSIATYVARTREPIRFSKSGTDARFPDGISDESHIQHILCQAIMYPDGQLAAVLELWRGEGGTPFYEEDEEIATSYLVWGGIALHYAHLYRNMNQQRRLNDFLLNVVRSIFQDMVSMDLLIMKIMNFTQKLVDADRASLFLVDSKNEELYATIFDISINDTIVENTDFSRVHTSKEIRFPIGTGIAGQVAMTGEILNIPDAYSDPRFNRTVDQLTGYKTNSILCMPIFIRGVIIGVVQMVNKHGARFTKEDEDSFQMFAVYCGLALHHAKLYDKIQRSEQKHRVALDVLGYHSTCTEDEIARFTPTMPELSFPLDDCRFNPFEWDDLEKARLGIYMFTDLFGLTQFDEQSLLRFTLTVKKNYRRVPYHNWTHGFSVAHCMYYILKHSQDVFKPHESLALYIAALCHDLDHRGKNNKFMLETESPLAAVYSTSTLEHHHFNQTVIILQQEGHNIFSKLSSGEYKQVLSLIKHCILATDLALFFPNKTKLGKIVQENSFSWSNQEHRLLIQAISMTASDLCASAKPWETQVETVKVIFEEFYEQGDEERASGRIPIPMMDRNLPNQQAASQVGFLTGICSPCYSLLHSVLPETKPLLNMCHANLERWKAIAKEVEDQRLLRSD